MNLSHLKTVRVIVSLTFFVLSSALFLDFGNIIPSVIRNTLVSLQLIPSSFKLMSGITLFSSGLFFVLTMTLLFGRVYCSSLCPLGTFQDFIIRASRRQKGKRRFRYSRPFRVLPNVLLGLTIAGIFTGSLFLLDVLEPFSNFGRIINSLVRPFVAVTQGGMAWIAGQFDPYLLSPLPVPTLTLSVLGGTLLFLGVVASMSWQHGRLFCNTLCPAGAALGLVSRCSLFTMVLDEPQCKGCRLCEKVCKARCIDSDNLRIDFDSCVGCFNCMAVCPRAGVTYRGRWSKKVAAGYPAVHRQNRAKDIPPRGQTPARAGRRRFFKNALGSFVGVAGISAVVDSSARKQPLVLDPVTPPGSLSREHFTGRCTACHLCVSVCPTGVLAPSFLEYGIAGVFQPRMNYDVNYCNFDCTLCSEVCPSGAILPVEKTAKKQIQIGKTTFVKDDCIVITKKKDCGACSEHCPTKAVKMVPYEGRFLPEVHNEYCVGCGACEHACPVTPRKAIYVKANAVHQVAEKPPAQLQEKKAGALQEFPF